MAHPVAVTNTSPVIALAGIGELRLYEALFDRVLVPFDVWDELVDKPGAPEPDALRALRNIAFYPAQPIPVEAAHLDAGERAAIALAVTIPGAWLLLDDKPARGVARALRLTVKGTLGMLVEAKRQGLVAEIRAHVEAMLANGCRFAPELVDAVLRSAGEA